VRCICAESKARTFPPGTLSPLTFLFLRAERSQYPSERQVTCG